MLMHTYGIQKNGTDDLICKAEIETQMQRPNVWTPKGNCVGWDELRDWDCHIYTTDTIGKILGWPKSSFGFFHKVLKKNRNEHLVDPIDY